jgi:hypothetical protein
MLLLIHGTDQGRDVFLRELADRLAKELFVFREEGKRRCGERCKHGICHENTSKL